MNHSDYSPFEMQENECSREEIRSAFDSFYEPLYSLISIDDIIEIEKVIRENWSYSISSLYKEYKKKDPNISLKQFSKVLEAYLKKAGYGFSLKFVSKPGELPDALTAIIGYINSANSGPINSSDARDICGYVNLSGISQLMKAKEKADLVWWNDRKLYLLSKLRYSDATSVILNSYIRQDHFKVNHVIDSLKYRCPETIEENYLEVFDDYKNYCEEYLTRSNAGKWNYDSKEQMFKKEIKKNPIEEFEL